MDSHLIELVDELEKYTLGMESKDKDDQISLVHFLFQAAHNLKSGLAMAGLNLASSGIHDVESWLDSLRRGKVEWSTERERDLLQVVDTLHEILTTEEDKALIWNKESLLKEQNTPQLNSAVQDDWQDWVNHGYTVYRLDKLFQPGLSKEVFHSLPVWQDMSDAGTFIIQKPDYDHYASRPEPGVVSFYFASVQNKEELENVFYDPLMIEASAAAITHEDTDFCVDNFHVLVAEDDVFTGIILKKILSKFGTIELVENGALAVASFKKAYESGCPFDLAIIDLFMPVLDGRATLEAIRNFESSHNIFGLDRCILVVNTAAGDYETVRQNFRAQADGYFIKPFSTNRIVTQVSSILEKRKKRGM